MSKILSYKRVRLIFILVFVGTYIIVNAQPHKQSEQFDAPIQIGGWLIFMGSILGVYFLNRKTFEKMNFFIKMLIGFVLLLAFTIALVKPF